MLTIRVSLWPDHQTGGLQSGEWSQVLLCRRVRAEPGLRPSPVQRCLSLGRLSSLSSHPRPGPHLSLWPDQAGGGEGPGSLYGRHPGVWLSLWPDPALRFPLRPPPVPGLLSPGPLPALPPHHQCPLPLWLHGPGPALRRDDQPGGRCSVWPEMSEEEKLRPTQVWRAVLHQSGASLSSHL